MNYCSVKPAKAVLTENQSFPGWLLIRTATMF